jgi:membrane protein implicated in regulation of membrane protease activity
MTLQWLVNWWNLIFLLPFGLALLYLGLYTVSGVTFGESDLDADHDFDAGADVDVDADADAGADVDHGIDHDVDADADADADADHDADTDHDTDSDSENEAQASPVLAIVSWLGVGKVPLSIVLMVFLLTWGAAGLLCNLLLVSRGAMAAAISLPMALMAAVLVTHWVSWFIGRYLPLYETTAKRRHALLGATGEAILPIDQRFGMASVRDETGDLYQVPCRADDPPIPKGSTVKLVSYNAKQGIFYVTQIEPARARTETRAL